MLVKESIRTLKFIHSTFYSKHRTNLVRQPHIFIHDSLIIRNWIIYNEVTVAFALHAFALQ